MRDGRCCSTGMPEKVNFAESRTMRAVDGGERQLGNLRRALRGEAADDAAGRDVAGDALDRSAARRSARR